MISVPQALKGRNITTYRWLYEYSAVYRSNSEKMWLNLVYNANGKRHNTKHSRSGINEPSMSGTLRNRGEITLAGLLWLREAASKGPGSWKQHQAWQNLSQPKDCEHGH